VRTSSPAVADLVTRYLLIDERPSQSVYAIPSALAQCDPTVAAFERWARERLTEPITIPQAAKAAGPGRVPKPEPAVRLPTFESRHVPDLPQGGALRPTVTA
jgi:hypothetical protein